MLDLAAPGVRKLNPYLPGKPIEELQREYGLTQVIKLASNENPLGPSPLAIEAIQKLLLEQSRYPDGNGFILKQALAAHLCINQNQITLGNGSNDVLELLARAFVTEAHQVIFSQHAFAVYPLVTQAINAKAVVTQAKDWGHDLVAMSQAVNSKTRLIFIANPNNPTGTWLTKASLEAFIADLPPNVIVVVDEAYFEYAHDERMQVADYPDCLQWIQHCPNLVVTRTFSKAYGLAGFRVGYCISNPDIADLLNRVRQPFNVNGLALVAASAALGDKAHLDKTVETNCSGLLQLAEGFKSLGLDFISSAGNFICVDTGKHTGSVYEGLLRKGVIVRPVENYAMPNHLRISVGLKSENRVFLQALKQALNQSRSLV